jgi:hypothetical protein
VWLALALLASVPALSGSFLIGSCLPKTQRKLQVPVSIAAPVGASSFSVGESVVFLGTAGTNGYLKESHGSVSPSGDKIVFRSNWNRPHGPVDAYVITLDATPVTDTDAHATPDIPRPAYLTPMTDPVFGQTVTRITDAGQPIYNPTADLSLNGRSWELQSGHGYSSRVAWNADQSLLVMGKGVDGAVFLDGATFEPLFQTQPPGTNRWHPTDPASMVFVDEDAHCVGVYHPASQATSFSRCFTGYDSFEWSDPGKGKPSLDGNVVPIRARRSGDAHWVALLYRFDTDAVSAEVDMTALVEAGDAPDFTMSPHGDVVIVNGCVTGHHGRCKAQVAIDVTTQTELWRVLNRHDPGHSDELVDSSGNQWRVGLAKSGRFKGHVIKRNFWTGEDVSVLPYWGSHTSTRSIFDPRGIAVVSYQERKGPLRGEIVGVCLDGSCLERYAHTHRVEAADPVELTKDLVWTSNLDGLIGTGGLFSTSSLSEGSHTISAELWDVDVLLGRDQVRIEILSPDSRASTFSPR